MRCFRTSASPLRFVACAGLVAALGIAAAACSPDVGPSSAAPSTATSLFAAPETLTAAALAANCYTCHVAGTDAQGIPDLAALNAQDIASALERYRLGATATEAAPEANARNDMDSGDPNTVMHRIARALTAQQIVEVAAFVAAYPHAGLSAPEAPVSNPGEGDAR